MPLISQYPPAFLLNYCIKPPFLGIGNTASAAKDAAYLRCATELRGVDRGIVNSWSLTDQRQDGKWECSYFVITRRLQQQMSLLERQLADSKSIRVVLVERNHKHPSSVSQELTSLLENLGGFVVSLRNASDVPSVVCQYPNIFVVPHELMIVGKRPFLIDYKQARGSGHFIVVGSRMADFEQDYFKLGCSWMVSLTRDWKSHAVEAFRLLCEGTHAKTPSQLVVQRASKYTSLRESVRNMYSFP